MEFSSFSLENFYTFFYIIKSINFYKNFFYYKNFFNIFFIFNVILWLFLLIFYLFFFNYLKEVYFFKYIIINLIYYLILIYLLRLKLILNFLLKNIYFEIGVDNLNSLSFLLSLFWIIFTYIICIQNNILFEIILEELQDIDLNLKFLLFKFLNSLIFFIIIVLGFAFMDLDIFILTVTITAFGLGLSITIQKLISNYISGLIILSDKMFKIGDAINVNGFQGVITQINSRCVILRNLDCSEILVPNEKFINDVIQNQSLFFAKGNLRISLQISYNNDINLVLNILIKSLNGVERILDNPIPISYFNNFIINGIELELSFWIIDAIRGAALVKSEVNINIWNNLKKYDIELLYSRKIIKILN